MKQDSIRIAADSQAKFNNNTAFCIVLMLKVDAGRNQAADLVLQILKASRIPEGRNRQPRRRMRIEDDALAALDAALGNELLDVVGQVDDIIGFGFQIEALQHC